ncbi:fibrillin-1-like [Dreissena polymorpha]|uniref:fibrillin-1-like n=1 Tax=Dreissena polymorpha TaxID=45954 RepID=UPI0022644447|nr:fibrillin-1-like [Dreissena polymorpha]
MVTHNQLFYQSYDFSTVSNANVNAKVKGFVNESYGEAKFEPIYVLKATWNAAKRFGGNDNVTFQVIFTSNGTHSYSFNWYYDGGMLDSFDSPFIGYIADGDYEGLDNTEDGSFLRRADKNLKLNRNTNLFANDQLKCNIWYKKEKSKASIHRNMEFRMPVCPCFYDWLQWDRSFSLLDATWHSTYVIHVPMEPARRLWPYGKSCAYNAFTGSFIGFGLEAGTFASVNRLIASRSHQLEDLHFKNVCCEKTDLCGLYWEVRPLVSQCYSWFPFSLRARGVGDPHFNTLDGATYTFNGHGEYMMMKIIEQGLALEIQCRTRRAKKVTGDLSDATVFSGFAIQGDRVWMQVELNEAGDKTRLFVGTRMTTAQESIFKYADGYTHANFIQENFTPKFLEEANATLRAEAEQKCNANLQCVFDFIFTGNEQLARETERTEELAVRANEAASNQIPNITVVTGTQMVDNKNILILNVNETKSITVKGEDDGSTITVTDSKNVSAPILDIVIVVCSLCSGHGTCNTSVFREAQGNPNHKLATCQCEPYWTGDDCQTDFDACTTNPCSFERNCTDTKAEAHKANPSLPAYTCTPCPAGFEDKTDKCEDINECNNQPCGLHSCVNTVGSFSCVCNAGYRLSSTNNSMCNDINECDESTSGCEHICNNTQGSVTCACFSGFVYNSTSKQCKQDTPPSVCIGKCNGTDGCVDANNTAKCFCKAGYKLNGNNTSCEDINECDTIKPCSQKCNNSDGSYQCSCYDGYTLGVDKTTCEVCQFPNYGAQCSKICQCGAGSDSCDPVHGCVCKTGWSGTDCDIDINECDTPNKCVHSNKVCTNTVGSYTCTCREGFENSTCEDIDECQRPALNTCSQNCTNTIGGFICSCAEGYIYNATDSTQCADIDECAAGVSGCTHICFNYAGRFSCDCYFGFQLQDDRQTCVLANDVCMKEFPDNGCSDICRADLQNKTYKCLCNTGYKLGADNKTCIDINECEDSFLNECSQTYVNTRGGYTCACNTGFKLANDLRTCDVCDPFHYGDNCTTLCGCDVGAERCDSVTGCVCKQGWIGAKCNIDENECADPNRCPGSNTMCSSSYQCGCMTGYTKEGANCVDIDECLKSNDCQQICTNTVGSYKCSCNPGYVQNDKECTDIDECTNGQSGCAQVCTNTDGRFRCSCNEFYMLADDKKACLPQEKCSTPNLCTNGVCAMIHATETCPCNAGFQFKAGNITVCEDIKECAKNPNPCSQSCLETEGYYECACNQTGYQLAEDKTTCINCSAGKFGQNCTQTCDCVEANTESCARDTGTCTCKAGLIGTKCEEDKNECSTDPCTANSTCQNTNGSYVCDCNSGYIKSADGTCRVCRSWQYGARCASDCECDTNNSLSCSNTNGTCTCKNGWRGDNCTTNVNECQANPTICNDSLKTCKDELGSYTCDCNYGYILLDGVCTDIDECLEGTDNCTQMCNNTVRGFECECNPGFSGTGNNCTACADATWGVQCNRSCGCVANNTQICDKATGCTCKTGWKGTTCSEDRDECSEGTHNCRQDPTCVNNNGSFTCPCNIGYTDVSNVCTACSNNNYGNSCNTSCNCNTTNALVSTQTCNHVNGTCLCKAQWEGATCEADVDECKLGTHNCGQDSTCVNNNGSFTCPCNIGYINVFNVCTACSNNKYGDGCNKPCNCNATNTLTPTQSCNNVNGTCMCTSQWQEPTCITDADECQRGTHNCSANLKKFCHNTIGGFACSCLTGFKEGTNGECVAEGTMTTTLPQSENAVVISVRINIAESKVKNLNFSVKATFDEMAAKLNKSIFNYFKNPMGSKLKQVTIHSIKIGSLDVNASLIKEKSEEASQVFSQASQDLINGTLVLDGESFPSNLYAINGIPIDTKKTAYEQTCAIYLSDRGQCDNNYACVVVDERPSCESVKKDNDLGLVLGLGIGIPLGLIACLAVAVIIIYALRNRRRKQSTDNERDSINNGFFTRGIPVKIDTWGRHDPLYKQHSRQWDSSSSSFSDDDRSSRLYKGIEYPAYRGIEYPAQDRYVYDNQQQPSNFSWDFIYKYISPDDSYRIQRPVTERRPNPIFEGTNM